MKPFDLADLLADLKAQGLPVLENDIEILTKAVLAWVAKGCIAQGGFAALVAPAIPLIQEQILKLEDKIDGVSGQ